MRWYPDGQSTARVKRARPAHDRPDPPHRLARPGPGSGGDQSPDLANMRPLRKQRSSPDRLQYRSDPCNIGTLASTSEWLANTGGACLSQPGGRVSDGSASRNSIGSEPG